MCVCLMRGITGSSHDARAGISPGEDRPRLRFRAFGPWLHFGGIPEVSPLSVGSRIPFKPGLQGSIWGCGGMLLS